MDKTLEIAQQASQQSDRTLFIYVIIILAGLMVTAMWTFIRDLKDSRAKHLEALVNLSDKTNIQCKEVTAVVSQNSEVLRECSTELRFCREDRQQKRT